MKTIVLSLLLLFSLKVSTETTDGFAPQPTCFIELFSKVYRFENDRPLTNNDFIQKTNCEKEILFKLSQVISNSSGTMGVDFLNREMLKDFPNHQINITPRKLSLLELNTSLKDQLGISNNLYFFDLKSLNGILALSLKDEDIIKAYCENCNSPGEKNVKIDIINPITNSTKSLWFSTKMMTKIKIFKARKNLTSQQQNLKNEDFYADEIFSSNPENDLVSLDNIHFYKPGRTIVQGSVISHFDLQPVNLVNYGTPVNLVVKNHNINLQKSAMPMRSAQFGELVEVKNTNNDKIISGKVIDYNKVVIEL